MEIPTESGTVPMLPCELTGSPQGPQNEISLKQVGFSVFFGVEDVSCKLTHNPKFWFTQESSFGEPAF